MKNFFPLRFILILGLLTLGAIFSATAAPLLHCEKSNNVLRAEYLITSTNANNEQQQTTVVLWRNNKEVANQYPQTGITEAWQLINGKLIKPIRFFDQHQRAIEYQPGESVHGKRETNWSYRYQFIADEMIQAMQVVESTSVDSNDRNASVNLKSECETSTLAFETDSANHQLVWLSEQKLIQHYETKSARGNEQWQLVSLEYDAERIEHFFSQRHNYYSTDFADIGDDHTDPFLTQMVTQGFVQKGASGFYDDKGNAIGEHHHH